MLVRQIRLSQQAKDQLSRLKGKTGIQHWNVLCRWAFCLSLSEATEPVDMDLGPDSNVEISWQVFGGEYQEIYEAVLKQRYVEHGMEPELLQRKFRLHLHRGISYLSAPNYIRTLPDLLSLAVKRSGNDDGLATSQSS